MTREQDFYGGKMKNSEIAIVARKTVDVIIRRGWCQGQNETGLGEVCAVAGLALALGVDPVMEVLRNPAYLALLDYISEVDRLTYVGVTFWNDKPGRTANEVIETLLSFAKEIEVTGGG